MTLFLYCSLYDLFLVFRHLRSSCHLLHLSFHKLVVHQGFEVRVVTMTVFNGAYFFKTNDRFEL